MAAARPLPIPSSAAPPPVTIATFPTKPHSSLAVIVVRHPKTSLLAPTIAAWQPIHMDANVASPWSILSSWDSVDGGIGMVQSADMGLNDLLRGHAPLMDRTCCFDCGPLPNRCCQCSRPSCGGNQVYEHQKLGEQFFGRGRRLMELRERGSRNLTHSQSSSCSTVSLILA
jgi:hypothetical protein